MKKRKIVALITSLLITIGMFAGCGTKTSTNGAAVQDENVTIKLACWGSSPAETKLLDDQIAEFNKTFPKIKVEKQVVTGDYNQAMQAKIASKTEPDVYYLDVSLAPMYMSKGVLAPIDEYLDKNDVSDFQTNLLAGFQKDGKTYGLPKDYNTLALFYNKDMFTAAGIANPPTTWAELEADAKLLTKDKVKGLALADDPARFAPFIYQAGGKIMDGENTAFNSAEGVKGLDFYYSLFKKGYAATPKDLGEGWNGDALAHKKAAMVLEGGWMIPYMETSAPDVKYGIANLPTGDTQGDLAFTVAYVVSNNSKHKKAAAEVVKFLTGVKAQQMTADSGLAIPTRKSMGDAYTAKYPERKALVDMTQYSTVYQFGLNHSKVNDALAKAGEKLRLGSVADAKAALVDAENNSK